MAGDQHVDVLGVDLQRLVQRLALFRRVSFCFPMAGKKVVWSRAEFIDIAAVEFGRVRLAGVDCPKHLLQRIGGVEVFSLIVQHLRQINAGNHYQLDLLLAALLDHVFILPPCPGVLAPVAEHLGRPQMIEQLLLLLTGM